MTLKGHLTRLTSELSEHHQLLEELRSMRDTDGRALREKSREVDVLRREVERLGGEVEVLRGVVEEGLKERREIRERSVAEVSPPSSHAILRPADDSLVVEPQNQAQDRLEVERVPHQVHVRLPIGHHDEDTDEDTD